MIFLVDQRRGAVIAMDALDDGSAFRELVVDPVAVGPLRTPAGIASDDTGRLFVADRGNDRIVFFDLAGGSSGALAPPVGLIGPLQHPSGVAALTGGSLLVTDTGNRRVLFFNSGAGSGWSAFGSVGTTAAGGFEAPTGVCVDYAGRIVVTDPGAGRLVRFAGPDGSGFEEIALPSGARPSRPYAVAAGPGNGLLVTDLVNGRVLLLAPDDTLTELINGSADRSLIAPVGLATSGDDVLIADAAAASVTRWRFDADSASWQLAQRQDGRGSPRGGPEFSSLSSLAILEQL